MEGSLAAALVLLVLAAMIFGAFMMFMAAPLLGVC